MGRPTFSTYFVGVLVGAILGIGCARFACLLGGITVPIFITVLLPLTIMLTIGAWGLGKHHPMGLPLGFVNLGLLLATVFSWVSWSNGDWFVPRGELTQAAAGVAFLVSAPGLLRWVYCWRVKHGHSVELTASALVDENVSLACTAAERLGQMTLDSARRAVPLLLWAADQRESIVGVKAEHALRQLSCPARGAD